MITGRRRILFPLPAILLLLGGFASLTAAAPVLAAPIQYLCPSTESQLQTDIGDVGAGGTVTLSCSTTTTIYFDTANGHTGTGLPITISQDVTLDASHLPGTITFDGGGSVRLFQVNFGVSFGLVSLTLAHAHAAYGGAIYTVGGWLNLTASTFSGSSAVDGGGAILNEGTATITASTFSGNSAVDSGGAILNGGGTVTIGGDVIANSPSVGNCANSSTITDDGYNLDDDGTCTNNGSGTGDITGEDPLLASLGNYGGPTPTKALLPGSPAIDQIPLGYSFMANSTTYDLCPTVGGTDQRGYPRPDSNDGVTETACDIGAYEYQDTAYTLPGSHTAYDIESSNWACSGGGISCVPPTDTVASNCLTTTPCPGATYGDVEAFGPPDNASYGIPDELILACAQGTSTGYQIGYLDVVSHQGMIDYPAGTRSFPGVHGTADLGGITGKGTLIGGGGSEDNPSQASSVSGSAYDATTGIVGSVSGIQNTDNQEGANTLNAGGFRVTIRGRLWTVTTTEPTPVTTRNTTSSTISCTVGGLHANDLRTAGIDTDALAEGELENSLGDNQFLPTFAPHSMPT